MMINYDVVIKEKINSHNQNWTRIPGHKFRILKIGGSGSGKNCIT